MLARIRGVALGAAAFGLWAGCVASPLPPPTDADAMAATRRDHEVNLGTLVRGRELTLAMCGDCHTLKSPADLPVAQWPGAVQRMRDTHGVRLTADEADAIIGYLQAMAARMAR